MNEDKTTIVVAMLPSDAGLGGVMEMPRRVYSLSGISPTIRTMTGGNLEPKVMVVGNYSPSGHNASRVVARGGLAPTVMENHGTVTAVMIDERHGDNNSGRKA